MFDLDTGILSEGVVSSDSLKDIAPDPSGTGRRVRINSKGQVVEIVDETLEIAPRVFRAVFQKDSGVVDTDAGVDELTKEVKLSTSLHQYYYSEYRWVVPDTVSRISVQMTGGGMGYKEDLTQSGDDSNYQMFNWVVDPGETIIVRVGHGGAAKSIPGTHQLAHSSIRTFDDSKVATSAGKSAENLTVEVSASDGPWRGFGHGGQSSGATGQDGLVIIEYYA